MKTLVIKVAETNRLVVIRITSICPRMKIHFHHIKISLSSLSKSQLRVETDTWVNGLVFTETGMDCGGLGESWGFEHGEKDFYIGENEWGKLISKSGVNGCDPRNN